MVIFRSILLIIVIVVMVLAVIGLGWQTFFAGVQRGAEKVGITKALNHFLPDAINSSSANTINSTGLR